MLTLIRKRAGLVLAGLVAVLCPMLMAPSGGFPSNPLFQSVGVNTASAGFGSFIYFGPVATSSTGMIGVANTANGICGTPAVSGDLCLRSTSGRLLLSTNNGASSSVISAPIVCSTACNIAALAVGQSAVIYKSGTTSRASSTALTVDNDLQFTNAPAGSYSMVYNLDWSTGAGGYNYQISFSGGGSGYTTGTNLCSAVSTTAVVATAGGSAVTCATSSGGQSGGQAVVNSGAAATIGVFWSQNTSNVANSSLTAPSSAVLTRVL